MSKIAIINAWRAKCLKKLILTLKAIIINAWPGKCLKEL